MLVAFLIGETMFLVLETNRDMREHWETWLVSIALTKVLYNLVEIMFPSLRDVSEET